MLGCSGRSAWAGRGNHDAICLPFPHPLYTHTLSSHLACLKAFPTKLTGDKEGFRQLQLVDKQLLRQALNRTPELKVFSKVS